MSSVAVYTGGVGQNQLFWEILKTVAQRAPESTLCIVPDQLAKQRLQEWLSEQGISKLRCDCLALPKIEVEAILALDKSDLAEKIAASTKACRQIERDVEHVLRVANSRVNPHMRPILMHMLKQVPSVDVGVWQRKLEDKSVFWIGFNTIADTLKPLIKTLLQAGVAHSFELPWESQHPAYAGATLTKEWLDSLGLPLRELYHSSPLPLPKVYAKQMKSIAEEVVKVSLDVQRYAQKNPQAKLGIYAPESYTDLLNFHLERLGCSVGVWPLTASVFLPADAVWVLGLGTAQPHPLLLTPDALYGPGKEQFRIREGILGAIYQAKEAYISTLSEEIPFEITMLEQLLGSKIPVEATRFEVFDPPSMPRLGLHAADTRAHWQHRFDMQRLSASQFESYQKCPQYYFLKYGLKLPEPEDAQGGVTAAEWGRFIHEVFQKWGLWILNHTVTTHQALTEALINAVDEACLEGDLSLEWQVKIEGFKTNIVSQLVEWQVQNPWQIRLDKIEEKVEFDLDFDDHVLKCTSRLDAIAQKEEGAVIIDYKTSKTLPSKSDLENLRSLQLPFYHMALRHLDPGIPVLGGILIQAAFPDAVSHTVLTVTELGKSVIDTGRKRPHVLTNDYLERFLLHLKRLSTEMREAGFSTEASDATQHLLSSRKIMCERCGYREGCRYEHRF